MKKLIIVIVFVICGLGINMLTIQVNAQCTVLLNFTGTTTGSNPFGSLVSDSTYLYGMTNQGGANGDGTAFKIKPDGTGYANLLNFSGTTNGSNPRGSFYYDSTYLYGMTMNGGANGDGTIFKIKTDGTGYANLLSFSGTANGSNPEGSLITDGTYLYGMTNQGGANSDGVIFKIKKDGSGYSKLLDFAGTSNGSDPYFGALYYDGTYLYGMTGSGGANNDGTIFKIKTNGTGYTKLLDFAGTTNGSSPYGSLVSDGTYLYGTTQLGGANGYGTIFKIKPDGTGYLKLLDFSTTPDANEPYGSLLYNNTFLYGMTYQGGTNGYGTVFEIKTDGTGYEILKNFTGSTNESYPYGSLYSDGTNLYGMTFQGGSSNDGVVFKLAGVLTGVNEIEDKKDISVYPNPAVETITIEIKSNNDNTLMSIYNLQGELIQQQILPQKKNIIDISSFAKGFYFIKVSDCNGVEIKRIAKM